MGQVQLRGMGASGPSSPGTAAAPAGTPAGAAIAAAAQPSFTDQFFGPDFFNSAYGNYPLYPQAQQPQHLVCKRHVDEKTGEETFDCQPKNPPPPTYRFPVYFPAYF